MLGILEGAPVVPVVVPVVVVPPVPVPVVVPVFQPFQPVLLVPTVP
jgi:hypothetical protein